MTSRLLIALLLCAELGCAAAAKQGPATPAAIRGDPVEPTADDAVAIAAGFALSNGTIVSEAPFTRQLLGKSWSGTTRIAEIRTTALTRGTSPNRVAVRARFELFTAPDPEGWMRDTMVRLELLGDPCSDPPPADCDPLIASGILGPEEAMLWCSGEFVTIRLLEVEPRVVWFGPWNLTDVMRARRGGAWIPFDTAFEQQNEQSP